MKYQVYNQDGEKVKEMDLNPAIFEVAPNKDLVHQAVVAQAANKRKPLAHTKDRGDVRGGGKKPWKQKGTGRARHGSSRSPLWIGGGVTFGPTNERNFSKKINKKMKKKALFACLSDRARDKHMVILDKLELKETKTKELSAILAKLLSKLFGKGYEGIKNIKAEKGKNDQEKNKKTKQEKMSILVVATLNINALKRAGKNIVGIKVLNANSLNVADAARYKYLFLGEDCLQAIEKTFLK